MSSWRARKLHEDGSPQEVEAARARRQGVGVHLIEVAREQSACAGCEWLHVDFEDHLKCFYLDACGFVPTSAGLIKLR